MPQARRTVQYLINSAYYLINVVSPDKIPSGPETARALDILNDFLDWCAVNGPSIPFTQKLDFNLEVGKSEYSISNINNNADVDFERIVELEYVNLSLNELNYPVRVISRADLYNVIRVEGIQNRPGVVLLIRENLQSILKFYPAPDYEYICTVQAKFMFDKLDLSRNIDEIPAFMQRYLIYELARELSSYYPSSTFTDDARAELKKMQAAIKATADADISILPDRILMNRYYGYGGFYGGWLP